MATLFFDLGNVLLFFSFQRMFEQMARVLDLPSHVIHNEVMNKGIGDDYARGKIDSRQYHGHLCRLAKKNVPEEDLFLAASDIFTPNLPMASLLRQLKLKGHKLILLSNNCEIHFSYAKKHYPHMLQSLDDFVLSYEVGYVKPELGIYRAALGKTQSPPSQCFYTDDIPAFIEGAAKADIPGLVFTGIDPLMNELRLQGYL